MTPIQKRAVGLVVVVVAYAAAWGAMARRPNDVVPPVVHLPAAAPVRMLLAGNGGPDPAHALHAERTDWSFRIENDLSGVVQAIAGCEWYRRLETKSIRVGTVWSHEHWAIARVTVDCTEEARAEYRVCLSRLEGQDWNVEQVLGPLASERAEPETY
jgi:hypothetical protein